jgi:cobalamin biosynthesis Mg chelatase CobN
MQALVLVVSVLAIVGSILSVQVPRYIQHHRQQRVKATKAQTPRTSPDVSSSDNHQRPTTDGTNSPPNGTTAPANAPSSSQSKPRKPWDPPFPTRRANEKEGNWLILPPTPHTAKQDAPSDDRVEDVSRRHSASNSSLPKETASEEPAKEDAQGTKETTGVMSIVWSVLAILGSLFLVLLFAVLIAHCLAWFIVYKTEARLGEARRGVVQGGEMRLCLCARG